MLVIGFTVIFLGFAAVILLMYMNLSIVGLLISAVAVMIFIAGLVFMNKYLHGKKFLNDDKKYRESLKSKQPWEK